MAYVGILLIAILVSFIAVRIGGFALQLTGIEPDVARFQALSAFSGTGFTTREAERVVGHRTRRRIVTILITGSLVFPQVPSQNQSSLLQHPPLKIRGDKGG